MKRLLIATVLVGGLFLCLGTGVGNWLVIEDPLRPAVAIAILGGKMPFRAMEAAELYRSGYAPEVWLPGMEGAAEHDPINRMGFSPFEHDLYYKVLERLGVPRHAVRVLSPSVKNTRAEVTLIAATLRETGGGRVIIVTSPWHTRRVKVIWWRVSRPSDELTVHYTRHEPATLRLDRWWERSQEREIVYREAGGMLDASLGFPLRVLGR